METLVFMQWTKNKTSNTSIYTLKTQDHFLLNKEVYFVANDNERYYS